MTFEHRLDGNEEAGLRNFTGRENSKLKSLELGVYRACKRNSKKARLPEQNRLRGEQQETKSARQALQPSYVVKITWVNTKVPGTAVAI